MSRAYECDIRITEWDITGLSENRFKDTFLTVVSRLLVLLLKQPGRADQQQPGPRLVNRGHATKWLLHPPHPPFGVFCDVTRPLIFES